VTALQQLAAAAKLRVPRVERELGVRARVEALEDYLLESAWHQGELAEARLELYGQLRELEEKWDHLDGWQALKRTKTEAAVDDAKRQLRPELYDGIKKARWLIRRLSEEIERLERDATKCSRAYTLATGS
jgi:hypothetical protein